MDYSKYRNTLPEIIGGIAICAIGAGIFAWLFYRSIYGMILFFPLYPLLCRAYKRRKIKEQKEQLLLEFKDGMAAVSAALLVGYSMENAWREAEKELRDLYGEKSLLYQEFLAMNAGIQMNQSLETVLADFAKRSDCQEIISFAEVFLYAKRGGGDFVGIIRTTIKKLAEKIEVEREIRTTLAGKILEGRIMNMMPLLILAYLNLCSKEYLNPLYGNVLGGIIMTGALILYGLSVKLAEHILAIRV